MRRVFIDILVWVIVIITFLGWFWWFRSHFWMVDRFD
jgi:hypothetical protein